MIKRPPYSGRINVQPGAQGVAVWYRRMCGRTFKFVLVYEGWWGVGPTGTLDVLAQHRGMEGIGNWYRVREFLLADADRALLAVWPEKYGIRRLRRAVVAEQGGRHSARL